MRTKLSLFAVSLIESLWLAAVLLVPTFFNAYSEQVFQADRTLLVRSIAVLIGAALLIRYLEEGGSRLRADVKALWDQPVFRAAVVFVTAWLIATLSSIAPRVSFWGSYVRRQGLYAMLSYFLIFAAVLLIARRRDRIDRIVWSMLVASFAVALYGLLQQLGLDPVGLYDEAARRPAGAAGNPVFLAAFVALTIPVALGALMSEVAGGGSTGGNGKTSRFLAPRLLLCAVLLTLQALVLFFSQGRGASIGVAVGLVFFLMLAAASYSSRRLVVFTASSAVAGAVFLLALNQRSEWLKPVLEIPYFHRLSVALDPRHGSGRIRTQIWEGAVDLFSVDPRRALVGYGPDALYFAYQPYYPPELAHTEQGKASPDRAHNHTLDALLMTGIVGFSAELALFLCVVGYGMRRLGLLGTRNGWMKLVAVTVTTGVAGGSLPYLIEGSFRFSAAAFACAVALSQIAFAMTRAWARPFVVPGLPSRDRFLLIGCLAAVLTHFVEIQFSFPVAETRLYFWVMCALSVVVAQLSANGTERVPAASADPLGGNVIGVLSGILLVALTFVVYTPDTDLRRYGPAVAILLFAVWLFAAVAVVSRRSGTPGGAKSLTSYAVASLGTWLAFVVAYHPWVAWTPPTDVPRTDAFWAIGVHCADTIVFPYVAFLLAILATAVLLAREEQSLPCPSWHSARSVTLSLAVTATALFIIVETNVIPARADAFSKQGIAFESLDQWEGARMVYEEAARLMRRFDHYAFRLGRVLMKSAYDVAQEGGDWRKELEQAQAQFDRARKIGPFDLDHLRNQARLHRLWALLADDAQEKRSHYGRAESLYVQATQLAPNHVIVWNDLALLYREMGRRNKALEALDQSLRIDARHPNAYSIRGDLLAAEDKLEPALRDYERALRYDSRKLEALSGRAFVLARLGRVEDAIEANLMVLQHAPGSFTTYRNLAILYRQKGSHDQALAAAQEALQRAPEGARAEISDLVAHLQSEREQRSSR